MSLSLPHQILEMNEILWKKGACWFLISEVLVHDQCTMLL